MEEPVVGLCLAIAAGAHAGQVDKAGADYTEHPKRVSARCTTTRQKCAALQKLTHLEGVEYMVSSQCTGDETCSASIRCTRRS